MPLYEYECEACGYRFEVIQRFSDPAIDACQRCGGPVRKLLSPPAIQFKGSGWYITDYARKSSGGSEAGKDKPASSEKSEKKDAGSSSAPAATSTSTPGGTADKK